MTPQLLKYLKKERTKKEEYKPGPTTHATSCYKATRYHLYMHFHKQDDILLLTLVLKVVGKNFRILGF